MKKEIKALIILLFFVVSITSCSCQSFLKYIPSYIDIGVTSKMMDSLKNRGTNTFLLYITTISKRQINEAFLSTDSVEATYFTWQHDGEVHVSLITDSVIYKDLILSTDTFLNYPHLNKTWLQEDEDKYQFVCPINLPDDKDIVIYVTPKSKMFFEVGRNVSYKLNPERNKYRYELIVLLKKALTLTNNKWVKASDYNRWIDFPEKKE
ncbi:MAG: hypothetical protein M0P47_11975 [Bacteroidales bacterium]|jgi:hypothetical protein|nr:hypothetical protein [Bacteroidales bacterium]